VFSKTGEAPSGEEKGNDYDAAGPILRKEPSVVGKKSMLATRKGKGSQQRGSNRSSLSQVKKGYSIGHPAGQRSSCTTFLGRNRIGVPLGILIWNPRMAEKSRFTGRAKNSGRGSGCGKGGKGI